MTNIVIALNPAVAQDSKLALALIDTNPPVNGTVKDCDSWEKLQSISDQFGVNSKSISWNEEILDWCIKSWGPAPA